MVSGFAATFLAWFFVFGTSWSFSAALPEQEVVSSVPVIQPSTDTNTVYRGSTPEAFNTGHGRVTTTSKLSRKKHGRGHGPVNTNRELHKYNHSSVSATHEPSRRHGPMPTGPILSIYQRYVPRHDDLRPEVLHEKLGTDFDATWMSPEEPLPESANTSIRVTAIDARLHKALSLLDFRLRDDQGRQLPVRSSTRRYLEKWLTERSSCPVQMVWDDLGVWFWPRWVRKGVCDSSTSCSWPPGMHCAPEASRTIRILRWRCRHGNRKRRLSGWEERRRRKDEELRCRWKKVPYPVTTGCYCSC